MAASPVKVTTTIPVNSLQQSDQNRKKADTSTMNENEQQTQFNRLGGLQTWRRTFIYISLFLGIFLSLMDTSIMATAIYTIAVDFNSLAKAFWAILSYQLAYLGFAVVFARLSDFIGRSVAVLSAFVLFVGFSLGCGWAQNIDQLIALRTLQGVGGAGLYAMGIILLIEVSTTKLLALTSSFIGATIAMSGVLGPIIGGVLTQYASWRWIFWINGPCGVLAIVCFAIGWPHNTTAYDSTKRRFTEFDYPGAFLIVAASVLVVFGIQEAGTGEYAWSSSLVLGTLISGCVCWLLLFAWEYYVYVYHRRKIASMFPFAIILNRHLVASIIVTMLTGFSFLLTVISLPLRFQIVNLRSPSAAGVHMLPLLCFVGLGSFLGGMASSKKNNVWQTFVVASCLIVLGVGLLSTLGNGLGIQAKCYGFQVVLGLGVGATFSAVSVTSAVSTDGDTHSVAQGIAAQIRIFAGSIGVATSNAIFSATCARELKGILPPALIQSLQTNTRVIATFDQATREAVRLAYANSFHKSLRICVYVAVASVVASILTYQKDPPKIRSVAVAAKVLNPGSQKTSTIMDEEEEEANIEKH